ERGEVAAVADELGLALDDDDVVAALEVDDDGGARGEVARLARLDVGREPDGVAEPEPPDRRRVRRAARPGRADPVVAGGGEALDGPRPRQLLGARSVARDAVARRHQ